MQKFSVLLVLVALISAPVFAQNAAAPTQKKTVAAQKKVDLGKIDVVVDNAAIAVRVTVNPAELQGLAQTAFDTHGRYRVVGTGHSYDIKFTVLAPTQVRVDITR